MPKTIEATIAEYIESNLLESGSAPLAHDASLVDLGILDSMAVAAMLAFTESEFGIVMDENEIELDNVQSVQALAALVRRKLGAESAAAIEARS
jgi:acyl carrier protein